MAKSKGSKSDRMSRLGPKSGCKGMHTSSGNPKSINVSRKDSGTRSPKKSRYA